jgi:mRNA-degrading endonuclease RelE of RelBE toxin-antitoxin system
MSFEIQFIPEAVKDYASLDGSIKKLVNDKIDKLAAGFRGNKEYFPLY